jgi:glycosyltransferase involved in cell wall biosynthesis
MKIGGAVASKPKLAIVSDTIRRDLHRPMVNFESFDICHFYHQASYGDMKEEDFIKPKSIQFKGMADLFKKIKSYRPEILQVPEPGANQLSFLAGLVCLVYYFLYRPKIIIPFFENRPLESKFNPIKLILVKWLIKRLANISSLLIVLNNGARLNLEKLKIKNNKMIHLLWGSWGIDMEEFKPMNNKENDTIMFLGRVNKSKGVVPLLQAFNYIKKENKNIKLVIAGPEGDAIEEVKTSQATYIGGVKNTEVSKLLSSATVVAMPSLTTNQWEEQVGMVGLQALSCGTPVVTFQSGAIPEFFKQDKGTQLIKEGDVEGLAKAMLKILNDKEYRHAQEIEARKYIKDNFEVKKSINKIEKTLLSII